MRTSIDIADGLLAEAKRRARADGTTLRALVEEGLREILGSESPTAPYRYEPVTRALRWRSDVDPGDWRQVKQALEDDELRRRA